MVNEVIQRILNGDTDDPEQLSKDLLLLSASLYTIGKAITEARIAYAKKWQEIRTNYKTDKSCEIAMMTMPEYIKREEAESAYKTVKEVIMSVKKRLSVLSDESKILY